MSGVTVSTEQQGSSVVVVLEGELDISTVPALTEATADLPESGHVIIDLSGVDFVDSSGLRSLLQLAKGAVDGCSFVCPEDNVVVRRLFEIFGVADAFPVVVDRAEAGVA